jgi:predicted PurR-regulated permease PerM
MFFFYVGGEKIIEKIKIITPLNDDFDHLLLMELYSLCGILTVSIFSIALIQGISFGFVTYFMDNINWFFIAVAIAVCSFIPAVGSLLVWIPLAIYLFVVNQSVAAIVVLIWGAVINGFFIDNLMRPWVISKICAIFNKNTSCDLSDFNPLDNTLIIILSTLGGLFNFGVIGLFLGPIIAAISLTIFDIYILRIESAERTAECSDDEIQNETNPDKQFDEQNKNKKMDCSDNCKEVEEYVEVETKEIG